jgi:hypothetical protein
MQSPSESAVLRHFDDVIHSLGQHHLLDLLNAFETVQQLGSCVACAAQDPGEDPGGAPHGHISLSGCDEVVFDRCSRREEAGETTMAT